jgi:hypothetical protein
MYLGKILFAQVMDSCRGKPSIASSIDTAAITGRVASVAPSSFASWPSRN